MPKLIAALLRHGDYLQRPDTPSAHQPFPLSDSGCQQAARAISLIQDALGRFDCELAPVIHSSRLLRAWQTANIIAEGLGGTCEVQEFDVLAERCVGSAANLTLAEIEQVISADPRYQPLPEHWKADSEFRLPLQGAESLREAGHRVAMHLRKTMEGLSVQTASNHMQLFVGHGAAFRHAASELGALAREDLPRLSMYHAQPVFLEYHPEQPWRLVAGNWKQRSAGLD